MEKGDVHSNVQFHVRQTQSGPSHTVYINQPRIVPVNTSTDNQYVSCSRFCCRSDWGYPLDVPSTNIGRDVKYITCSNCRNVVYTNPTFVSTKNTHLLALSLTPVCCCLLPYYLNIFKYVKHSCPVCETYIGFGK